MRASILWAGIGRSGGALSSILTNIIIFRMLQPSEAGQLFVIFSLTSLLSVICCFGFNRLNVVEGKLFGEDPQKYYLYVVASSLFVVVSLGFVALCFAILGSPISRYIYPEKWVIFALTSVVTTQVYFAELLRGLGRVRDATLIANFGAMGGIGFGLVPSLLALVAVSFASLTDMKLELDAIVLLSLTVNASALMLFIPLARKIRFLKYRMSVSAISLISTYRRALPFLFISLGLMLQTQIELWLVRFFGNDLAVGNYAVILRLMVVQSLPVVIIFAAIQPAIVRYSNSDFKRLNSILGSVVVICIFFMVPMLFIFFALAEQIISTLFGEGYILAADLLPTRSLSLVISTISGVFLLALMLSESEKYVLFVTVLSIISTVLISIILFPLFGDKNVPIAVLISAIISFIYALRKYTQKFGEIPVINGGIQSIKQGLNELKGR